MSELETPGAVWMPAALRVQGLTNAEKLVLLAVVMLADPARGGCTRAGQGQLARVAGVSRGAALRALKTLEGQGLVSRSANHRESYAGRPYRAADTVRVDYAVLEARQPAPAPACL